MLQHSHFAYWFHWTKFLLNFQKNVSECLMLILKDSFLFLNLLQLLREGKIIFLSLLFSFLNLFLIDPYFKLLKSFEQFHLHFWKENLLDEWLKQFISFQWLSFWQQLMFQIMNVMLIAAIFTNLCSFVLTFDDLFLKTFWKILLG